jgi:hypothetical protein
MVLGQFFPIQRTNAISLELPADGCRTGLKQPGHPADADLPTGWFGLVLSHQHLKLLSVDVGEVFTFLSFLGIFGMAHVNPPDVFVVIPSYRVFMSFSVSLHSTTRLSPVICFSPLFFGIILCIMNHILSFLEG